MGIACFFTDPTTDVFTSTCHSLETTHNRKNGI